MDQKSKISDSNPELDLELVPCVKLPDSTYAIHPSGDFAKELDGKASRNLIVMERNNKTLERIDKYYRTYVDVRIFECASFGLDPI